MNLYFIVFMILGLFMIGFQGESHGQPVPEPGEDQIYVEVDITDIVIEGIKAVVDAVVSFFEWICFWCDD